MAKVKNNEEKSRELCTRPTLSGEQIQLISGHIVKRAFARLGTVDAYVESYISKHIEQIVTAVLGIERSFGHTRLDQWSGYVGPLDTFVRKQALAYVDKYAPEVLETFLDDFKNQMSKELKRSVTENYDAAYQQAMVQRIKQHLHIDDAALESQAEVIINESRKRIEPACKAMMKSFILAAKGEHDDT